MLGVERLWVCPGRAGCGVDMVWVEDGEVRCRDVCDRRLGGTVVGVEDGEVEGVSGDGAATGVLQVGRCQGGPVAD